MYMIGCENRLLMSAGAGVAVTLAGFDRMLPAPPWVHNFLAGVAVDGYCRGFAMDLETATAGSLGVTAALAYATLMR